MLALPQLLALGEVEEVRQAADGYRSDPHQRTAAFDSRSVVLTLGSQRTVMPRHSHCVVLTSTPLSKAHAVRGAAMLRRAVAPAHAAAHAMQPLAAYTRQWPSEGAFSYCLHCLAPA